MMDILFIHPGNHKKTYQALSVEYTAIAPPMWTSLLANYVRNKGYTVAIHDVNVKGFDEKTIGRYNPNLIVIMVYGHQPSASTQVMPAMRNIVNIIRKGNRDIPIAIGGTHPSALPEKTLVEENVDYVIQGEGPYTIRGLIEYINGKGSIENIPGLWHMKNNVAQISAEPIIVKNLDEELSGHAWDLLPDLNNYRAHNMHCFQDFEKSDRNDFSDVRSPYMTLNTSLGCPYNCSYCCINATFGKPGIRYWSLEKVMLWIDTLVNKYKIRNIRFDDELFILSSKRVEKFCDMIIERKYGLNLFVYGRVDTIKESLLGKMKKAGINWISLGIESGNTTVRANVNKVIKKNIKEVVNKIQLNGIYVIGNYMFGLPEDNIKTMNETLNMAIDLNCEFSNFYCVALYPGSELYYNSLKKNNSLFHPSDNWNDYSQHGYTFKPSPTNYILARDILCFRDNAFIKYHSNNKYLDMIDNKFGNKTRSHIEKMLRINIKRKLLE